LQLRLNSDCNFASGAFAVIFSVSDKRSEIAQQHPFGSLHRQFVDEIQHSEREECCDGTKFRIHCSAELIFCWSWAMEIRILSVRNKCEMPIPDGVYWSLCSLHIQVEVA